MESQNENIYRKMNQNVKEEPLKLVGAVSCHVLAIEFIYLFIQIVNFCLLHQLLLLLFIFI